MILVAEAKRDYLRLTGASAIFLAVREAVSREYSLTIGEIVLVPPGAVPKTSSGKIRRRACRQAYLDGTLRILAATGAETKEFPAPVRGMQQAFGAPSDLIKEKSGRDGDVLRFLCVKISQFLRCPESEILTEKSLPELGLDSLQTVGLKHAVDEFLEIDLPLKLLLAESSLRALAKKIAALPPTAHLPGSSGGTGLSYTQRALWTVHRLDQKSISYNLHLALDVTGKLDTEILATALTNILQRHGQLRAIYHDDDGQLGQTSEPFVKLTEWLSCVDANGWNDAALQADIGARVRQPFDLECGVPLRVTIYRQGHGKSTLLFCAHHIAVDLWSFLLLIQEIDESYRELQSGPACKTTPAPDYEDFIIWQNRYLESSLATDDFDYWKIQLDRQLPILALPTDFPRPSESDYRGASYALRLDADLTAALKVLAAHHGVSLSTTLLAVYQVLLHRYSGQCEIVVGIPSSGRLRGEFARLVGNCVNPIAIVGRPFPALSFAEFLRQIGEQVRDALVHQNFPFPILVERLHPERQSDQWPIYQTSFVLQQAQEGLPRDMAPLALGEENAPFNWCGCEAAILPVQKRVENFDLKLMAAESEGGLVLSFQYRTELFLPATIARMAGHFSRLAAGIAASQETEIGELPLLTEVERHRYLAEWNATAHDYSQNICIHELFVAQAKLRPRAVAVSFGDQRLTYAELDEQTNQLAGYLRDHGVGPDDLVGLCVNRSIAMVVGILGILKAGGRISPARSRLSRRAAGLHGHGC